MALGSDPGGGTPQGWRLPPVFELTGQRGHGLDERIAAALAVAYARLAVPVVLTGWTPRR